MAANKYNQGGYVKDPRKDKPIAPSGNASGGGTAGTASGNGNATPGNKSTGFTYDKYQSSGAVDKAAGNGFTYGDFSYNDYQSSGAVDKAKGNGFSYGDFNKTEYVPSQTVQQASDALAAMQAAQPGAYQSQWQSQVNSIIDKIMNRKAFSYDYNEDALYQQYAEQYTRGGKLAMQDTMGQAAAMTGGYGSSYAAAAGNQSYQEYMSKLNAVIPELYDRALAKYQMEGEEMYNQYGLLSSQEQQDYGRYQDSYNQWLAERDYATGRYDTEKNFDYSKYTDERNFDYGAYADNKQYAYNDYRAGIEDAKWQEETAYNRYADDRNFDYGVHADNKQYAYNDYRNAIEDAKWKESQEYQQYIDAISNDQWAQSFAETQKQNAIGNEQWDKSFAYQQDRDTVADNQWNQSFEYQQGRDAVADSQWDKTFNYQQDRDKVSDDQWNKSFEYQQGRDKVSDSQWATARQDGLNSEDRAYAREDAMAVISAGKTPTDEQLKAAGMTKETAQALTEAYTTTVNNISGGRELSASDIKGISQQVSTLVYDNDDLEAAEDYLQLLIDNGYISEEQGRSFLEQYVEVDNSEVGNTDVPVYQPQATTQNSYSGIDTSKIDPSKPFGEIKMGETPEDRYKRILGIK